MAPAVGKRRRSLSPLSDSPERRCWEEDIGPRSPSPLSSFYQRTKYPRDHADGGQSAPLEGPGTAGPSTLPDEKELKIVTWNVNSIRQFTVKLAGKMGRSHRSGVLEAWFSEMNADIVCFQEVKIRDPQADLPMDVISVSGYDTFVALPKDGRLQSGVITYARHGLTKEAWVGFSRAPVDREEGRSLTTDHGAFILINIYAPCPLFKERRPYRKAWMDLLVDRIEELRSQGRKVIVAGDFNSAQTAMDVYKKRTFDSPNSSHLSHMERFGMVDVWRELNPGTMGAYTYWARSNGRKEGNEGWRIDLFVSDRDTFRDRVLDCTILPELTTWEHGDHCPVVLTLTAPKNPGFPTPDLSIARRPRAPKESLSEIFAAAYGIKDLGETERQNKTRHSPATTSPLQVSPAFTPSAAFLAKEKEDTKRFSEEEKKSKLQALLQLGVPLGPPRKK